jgi:hypothetical protein
VVSYGDRKTEAFKFENYKLEEIAKPAPLIVFSVVGLSLICVGFLFQLTAAIQICSA